MASKALPSAVAVQIHRWTAGANKQISMNVFIIGAGFTKAIFENAPLNRDLLEALAIKFPDSVSPVLCNRYKTQDIEIALTRLDLEISLSQDESGQPSEDIRKLRQRIESELASYFVSFCVSGDLVTQSQWLARVIDNVFISGDVAISLNYDCVLEGALDCRGKWSANGGYGSSVDNPLACNDRTTKSPVTVLKIHGSSNFVIAPYADKPRAKAVGFVFDEHFFPRLAKKCHFGYGARTGRSYLIAPSYVKIPTVEINYLMLDALTASTKAKNLVVIGSALRPEDAFLTLLITNFLRQPSWRKRKIIIVDPAAEAINNRLKVYWGVNVSSQILPIEDRLEASVERLLKAI
jgi:hypothetical protein